MLLIIKETDHCMRRLLMDFKYWDSLKKLKCSESWTRVNELGCKSKLNSEQKAVLVKLQYPSVESKKSARTVWFKLCNSEENQTQENKEIKTKETDEKMEQNRESLE